MRWWVCALLGGLIACSSTKTDDAPPAADAGAEAAAEAGAIEPSYPTLPYPAGPYGTGIGDVFPDFTIVGYRMTRLHRDSTKLPFVDLRLAEVRSDPACTCLVVIFNAAGTACGPCVQEDQTFATAMLKDPGMCAIEIIDFNYDTFDSRSTDNNQPATRADLDAVTQAAREPFPVGLMTGATRATLSSTSIPVIPDAFVMRPKDMRVVGWMPGTGGRLGDDARTYCGRPHEGPEVVAGGVGARTIAVDDTDVFFGDGSGAVKRVPIGGGAPALVATTSGAPQTVFLSGANVYWAASSEIGRAPIAGGGTQVLATTAAAYVDAVADDQNVYFTRTDGVVGSVPIGGGATSTLLSGEIAPRSIVADATRLYFLASPTELASVAKDGSNRTTVKKSDTLVPPGMFGALLIRGENLFVLEQDATKKIFGTFVLRIPTGLGPTSVVTQLPPVPVFAFDAKDRILLGSQQPDGDVSLLGRISSENDFDPTKLSTYEALLPGQRAVTAIAGSRAYVYYAAHGDVMRYYAP
jgi:hypothetical protein